MAEQRGHILKELGVVVLLLGLLSLLIFPHHHSMRVSHRHQTFLLDLTAIREAVRAYESDHGALPGEAADGFREKTLVRQLSRRTRKDGSIDPNGEFGPYLPSGLPPNPYNGHLAILLSTSVSVPVPTNSTGWIYNSVSGEVHANCSQLGPDGRALIEY